MPDVSCLRAVHEVLEGAFTDHFNSAEETFEEFIHRLREDPGHRWDHWWLAELLDDPESPEPVGALVGTVSDGGEGPDGSYVSYLGVLESARGRGVATGPAAHDHRRRRGPRAATAWGSRSTPTPRRGPTACTSPWAGPRATSPSPGTWMYRWSERLDGPVGHCVTVASVTQ